VLAGFHLTFGFDQGGQAITLKPISPGNVLENRYARAGASAGLVTQLQRLLPDAEIRMADGQIVLAGRYEDHQKLKRLLAGQPLRATSGTSQGNERAGEQVFTLKASGQPAGAVARQVAQALGKQLRYDDATLEKLKQPVTLDVQKVTADELLRKTLQPLGLTYRLTESELVIVVQ
jgi:hypothetical protein